MNITSCGRQNVRKQREIKNDEKYIILDIYSNLDCMDKIKFTSLESKDYMGRQGKWLTTYLDLRTKISNKKEKARFSIDNINNQDFRKFLKKFNNSPYLG